jgi:Flp pilus assembly protein TadD
VRLQQGRVSEAVARLEEAVRLEPANVEALNMLSTGYAALGDLPRALAAIDRALALAPSGPLADMLRNRRELLTKR